MFPWAETEQRPWPGHALLAYVSDDGQTWRQLAAPAYHDHDAFRVSWDQRTNELVNLQTTCQRWQKKYPDNLGDKRRRVLSVRTSRDGVNWDPPGNQAFADESLHGRLNGRFASWLGGPFGFDSTFATRGSTACGRDDRLLCVYLPQGSTSLRYKLPVPRAHRPFSSRGSTNVGGLTSGKRISRSQVYARQASGTSSPPNATPLRNPSNLVRADPTRRLSVLDTVTKLRSTPGLVADAEMLDFRVGF